MISYFSLFQMHKLTVRGDGAAAGVCTLNRAAPALGLSSTNTEGGHNLVVDGNCLSIVSSAIIQLSIKKKKVNKILLYLSLTSIVVCLTMHGDAVTSGGVRDRT